MSDAPAYRLRPGFAAIRSRLFRGAAATLAMRGFALLAGLLVAVVLARTLGAAGYGVYAFVFSLVFLLAVPIEFGLPTLAMREVARFRTRRDFGLLRGFLRWSHLAMLATATVIGAATLLVTRLLWDRLEANLQQTLLAAAALLAIGPFCRLRESILVGQKQYVRGQGPEQVVLPLLFLAGISLAWQPWSAAPAQPGALPQHAMFAYSVCALIAFILGAALLRSSLPRELADAAPVTDTATWRGSLLPLAASSVFVFVNGHFCVLALGLFATSEEVGLFRVAASGAALAVIVCASMGSLVSPHIAESFDRGDRHRLQSLAVHCAWVSLVPALAVLVLFACFGADLMRVVFGPRFEDAALALVILTAGQTVNSATGAVHCLLNMTGHARDTLLGVVAGGLATLVLAVLLIPPFGLTGAAVAASAAVTLENPWLWARVRSRLGVNSSVFGRVAP